MANLNWYYILNVFIIACGAIPKGYDEGGFSASVGLQSFKNDFNLNSSHWKHDATGLANRKANITSFGVLGAAFGSILAVAINDRLGRLKSYQIFLGVWMSGIFMQVFSSGIYGFLLFARIWGGLGAGGLTVVSPLFLSEIARARNRGLIVSIYMVVLLTVLSVGFFVNYGVSKNLSTSRLQYRLVQALPLIPSGIALLSSFFIRDSPRWLASKDREEEAIAALTRLRGASTASPEVGIEISAIHDELAERRRNLADVKTTEIVKEIFTVKSYRKRFALALIMQTVAQWSGGNGITYYIPEIFVYAGVQDKNSLITSGAYGIVKLIFTMVFAWGLVDYFGRRRSMLTGIGMQMGAHIYMAVYMALLYQTENKSASDAAIASIFIYAAGWSIGLCTVQYLYGTEIFPTRIRSVCYAVNMAIHWFFQFAVVRVTPNMLEALDIYGAFVFWACICFIGSVLLGAMAPETKKVPMEKMDELFEGPWYMGWKAKVDLRGMSFSDDEKMPHNVEIERVRALK